MSQIIKNLPFFNVAAGAIATLQLPLGMTYERIILELDKGGGGAFVKANIDDIKVKVNGKTIWQIDGTNLNVIMAYRGMATDVTHLVIDFSELKSRDEVNQSMGAIATAEGVSMFTLEVSIAAAAVLPILRSWSVVSGPRKLGAVAKCLKYSQGFTAAGKFNIQLPFGPNGGSLIKRIHIMHTNVTDLEIKKNGIVIHDTTDVINKFWQTENGHTTAAGHYCADFMTDNNQSGMLVTTDARSFECNVTVSAADTVSVFVEYIDLLGNL